MTPSQLTNFLEFAIKNTFPLMIKGRPGIGKSDIISQAAHRSGADLIISHPAVSDPTDYKGLPFPDADGTAAKFLPFGELNKLIKADRPTVFFLDDLGQAPASVQAGCMQLILARRINDHAVSPHVTFFAATNRREDKAGIIGILEQVKSRFCSIVELETTTEDWVRWALDNDMPTELIAFIRFRPATLEEFKATRDIENSPSPRTVAQAGRLQAAGLPKDLEFEAFKGAAGEVFAVEYCAFLKTSRNLPAIESIIFAPDNTDVPTDGAVLYAMAGMIAHHMSPKNIGPLMRYLQRLPGEIQVGTMQDARRNKNGQDLVSTRPFIDWAVKNHWITD